MPNPKTSFLYKYGVESDYFIIILDGCATVQVGRNDKERMEITAGLFSYYGVDALLYEHETDPLKAVSKESEERRPYQPEFSLKVNSYCVYLKIYRKDWKEVVRRSIFERTNTSNQASPNANSPVSLADTSNGSIILA